MAVTKITAKDDTAKAKKANKAAPKVVKETKTRKAQQNVFSRIWGYFKGAWFELRQVRWPNRRATWSLTLAVIVFSLFFVGLILLLDAGFKYLFELIIV